VISCFVFAFCSCIRSCIRSRSCIRGRVRSRSRSCCSRGRIPRPVCWNEGRPLQCNEMQCNAVAVLVVQVVEVGVEQYEAPADQRGVRWWWACLGTTNAMQCNAMAWHAMAHRGSKERVESNRTKENDTEHNTTQHGSTRRNAIPHDGMHVIQCSAMQCDVVSCNVVHAGTNDNRRSHASCEADVDLDLDLDDAVDENRIAETATQNECKCKCKTKQNRTVPMDGWNPRNQKPDRNERVSVDDRMQNIVLHCIVLYFSTVRGGIRTTYRNARSTRQSSLSVSAILYSIYLYLCNASKSKSKRNARTERTVTSVPAKH